MLTIVIKTYGVNVVANLKPIYLKKHYLFMNWFMLKIVIKAYCVNVLVDVKPIYLSKDYLRQSKIYD